MIRSLVVSNQYLYAKIGVFSLQRNAIKQVCLPVWEAAFLAFVSGVLVGESSQNVYQYHVIYNSCG